MSGQQTSHSGCFMPMDIGPDTQCIGGWVGSTLCLDMVAKRKVLSLPEIEP